MAGDRPAIRSLVAHTGLGCATTAPFGQLLRRQLGALRARVLRAVRGQVLRAGIPRANLEWVFPIIIKGEHTRWPQDRLINAFPPLAA